MAEIQENPVAESPRGKVLVVEDDRRTADLIALYLRHAGHDVSIENDGSAGLARAQGGSFDLLILDRMLPGREGIEIAKMVRQDSRVPVMFVTARTLEEDRLDGFESGADDYVTKPFSPRELVARVAALLRRTPPGSDEIVRAGDLTINLASRQVSLGGYTLELTPSEFAILLALAEHPGRVLSRITLLDACPGDSFDTMERTVDAHVRNIRRKIGSSDAPETVRIETVIGSGYRLSTGGFS